MFSLCYPEAENCPLRDGEDLLTGSPSWALPKRKGNGDRLDPLLLGKSPLGLEHSKLISQAWMGVDGHVQHSVTGLPQGVDNPMRLPTLNRQALEPQASCCGVHHGHGLAKQSEQQRLAGSRTLSCPQSRSDKTVCHLLIIWTSTIRLYLTQTQHLTTATSLQDKSCLYLWLPFP